ncbi:A/G-specific adenine glycosylase [Castellaniella caeni]|uniref:A/G-specific adenine glycosylase n=1 Tax=Castellaniella caeni TaxID=266123 RepID=UPI000C9F1316|nr:A/G-specific adenine glycosylase [Castellaniella caeni]
MSLSDPASRIAVWQKQAGRHDLPWQGSTDPYRIWLSEIMLQQTQASTVIPYYERFLARFPDVIALADAPADDVLQAWAGLGYYARARNLHRCVQVIRDTWQGRFPRSSTALAELPGIGRSTAAAIAAFAFGERAPILDGNVRRVLARYLALEGDTGSTRLMQTLWRHAQAWLDAAPADLDMRAYTQGQMDLGATICTRSRPDCEHCPLRHDCAARRLGLQDSLPTPRSRPSQPRHSCCLLILESDGRLWLQRRPAQGIWGGLWALPVFADRAALEAACRELAAPHAAAIETLAAFEHVFTHFRLLIQPLRVTLPGLSRQAANLLPAPHATVAESGAARRAKPNPALLPPSVGQSAWTALDALSGLGMPAPVARLLDGLYPHPPA